MGFNGPKQLIQETVMSPVRDGDTIWLIGKSKRPNCSVDFNSLRDLKLHFFAFLLVDFLPVSHFYRSFQFSYCHHFCSCSSRFINENVFCTHFSGFWYYSFTFGIIWHQLGVKLETNTRSLLAVTIEESSVEASV